MGARRRKASKIKSPSSLVSAAAHYGLETVRAGACAIFGARLLGGVEARPQRLVLHRGCLTINSPLTLSLSRHESARGFGHSAWQARQGELAGRGDAIATAATCSLSPSASARGCGSAELLTRQGEFAGRGWG